MSFIEEHTPTEDFTQTTPPNESEVDTETTESDAPVTLPMTEAEELSLLIPGYARSLDITIDTELPEVPDTVAEKDEIVSKAEEEAEEFNMAYHRLNLFCDKAIYLLDQYKTWDNYSTHLETYGADRTFLSLVNRNGRLQSLLGGVVLPSCEDISSEGDPNSQLTLACMAAVEEAKGSIWQSIKSIAAGISKFVKSLYQKATNRVEASTRKIDESKRLLVNSVENAEKKSQVNEPAYSPTLLNGMLPRIQQIKQNTSNYAVQAGKEIEDLFQNIDKRRRTNTPYAEKKAQELTARAEQTSKGVKTKQDEQIRLQEKNLKDIVEVKADTTLGALNKAGCSQLMATAKKAGEGISSCNDLTNYLDKQAKKLYMTYDKASKGMVEDTAKKNTAAARGATRAASVASKMCGQIIKAYDKVMTQSTTQYTNFLSKCCDIKQAEGTENKTAENSDANEVAKELNDGKAPAPQG